MLKMTKSMFITGLKYKFSSEAAAALYDWAELWEEAEGEYSDFNSDNIYETWIEFDSVYEAFEYFNIGDPPRALWKCQSAMADWQRAELEAVAEIIDFGLDQVLVKRGRK